MHRRDRGQHVASGCNVRGEASAHATSCAPTPPLSRRTRSGPTDQGREPSLIPELAIADRAANGLVAGLGLGVEVHWIHQLLSPTSLLTPQLLCRLPTLQVRAICPCSTSAAVCVCRYLGILAHTNIPLQASSAVGGRGKKTLLVCPAALWAPFHCVVSHHQPSPSFSTPPSPPSQRPPFVSSFHLLLFASHHLPLWALSSSPTPFLSLSFFLLLATPAVLSPPFYCPLLNLVLPVMSRQQPRPQVAPATLTRRHEFFMPRNGIDREVISADICRYLGNEALVRPGRWEVRLVPWTGWWCMWAFAARPLSPRTQESPAYSSSGQARR